MSPAPGGEIALAVKSPMSLARYVESHRSIEWKTVRNALGLGESSYWLAPCGSNFPAAEARCSTEAITTTRPDQVIVVIRGGVDSYAVEYLRYLRDANGGWSFSGENSALQRNAPSDRKLLSIWNEPFLAISSDHSQTGVATGQMREEWFDLTQPGFEPVFSFTVDGSQSHFGFGVGRTVHATCNVNQTANTQIIELTLNIHFDGVGLDQQSAYLGVYERRADEKTFKLHSASAGLDRRQPIPVKDFADLADPFSAIANEKLLVLAFSGLKKIATGSNSDAREWLSSVLRHTADTPEKRSLINLLTKP
ncbi:MAG TPA: hypothetical protein VH325_11575 [Bryobacteraceae bacterium]|nr:hypothetical protein [Bryobacteraceae bacterium]